MADTGEMMTLDEWEQAHNLQTQPRGEHRVIDAARLSPAAKREAECLTDARVSYLAGAAWFVERRPSDDEMPSESTRKLGDSL